jgi:hypothetical protein
MNLKTLLLTGSILTGGLLAQAQQLKTPAPSPLQKVTQNFGLSEVTVEYSRPSAKGRVVYGDVVPFDKTWRTGANASTKITFGEDVSVAGTLVKAGTYALYSVPGVEEWSVMLYSDLKLGGNVAGYDKANEVLAIKVKPTKTADKTETFTIEFANMTTTSMDISLVWENTIVNIPVKVDVDDKIMKSIDAAMGDNKPYFQAANYYFENGKDLNKALEWITKAVDANPNAYWVSHLKAKIQLKLGDADGAIATAKSSLAKATADEDGAYIKMNEKLIKEAGDLKMKSHQTPPIIPQPKGKLKIEEK